VVKELLNRNASTAAKNDDGETPLILGIVFN
jgi:ankyrin repeat protein